MHSREVLLNVIAVDKLVVETPMSPVPQVDIAGDR